MSRYEIDFPGLSGRKIDDFALKIIEFVQPSLIKSGEPLDIWRLMEIIETDLKIDFDFTNELPVGIYGCTSTTDNKVLILSDLADDHSNVNYFRSTMGHEFGHVFLHLPILRELSKDKSFIHSKNENSEVRLYRDEEVPTYKNPEWQAWRFSAALLMPEPTINKLIKSGASVTEMANTFLVNKRFLLSRLKGLKIAIV